ncbi:uncharacterized protein B0T15DRAFT_515270 [Chaetomium strumarium]|uniref:Uncharacterized protein n=1 Tax=Chaetomium strumarium TaxID=1170767 RepID=A0AAJ0M542_9PEZI|nr:hypothetical protein B0T15DRAFT_515270 [Chaetomium strumarium]
MQITLSAHRTSTPTSSGPVTGSPAMPRPAGPGGVASRNRFSSPNRVPNQSLRKTASAPTLVPCRAEPETTELPPSPGAPLVSITADPDPVLTVPSSGMDRRLPDPQLF